MVAGLKLTFKTLSDFVTHNSYGFTVALHPVATRLHYNISNIIKSGVDRAGLSRAGPESGSRIYKNGPPDRAKIELRFRRARPDPVHP
jgi:hypothetical protein